MKECQKCVLPATYPGISFDQNGVCNYCQAYMVDTVDTSNDVKGAGSEDLHLISEADLKAGLEKYKKLGRQYDVLVPLSGGVDSCFTLIQIVEKFGLKPLVFHSDHGWDDPTATRNVEKLCRELNVDLIIWKNDLKFMRKLFKIFNESDDVELSACFACGNMLYLNGLEIADHFNIPLVINGYSKGQIAMMHDRDKAVDWYGKMIDTILRVGDMDFFNTFTKKWDMLKKQVIYKSKQDLDKEVDLEKIFFIPLFVFKFYKTDKVELQKICRERFDWQPIKNSYPARTTNCEMIWLNSYRDLNKRCYTHYHDEYSTLIRAGEITREQALKDLELNPPEGLLERLANEVNINLEDLQKDVLGSHDILLVLMPFWPPLIPPLALANLKSFIQNDNNDNHAGYHYKVKTIDFNTIEPFDEFGNNYFNTLKNYLTSDKMANIPVVGKDVLQNHMMAYFHFTDENEYNNLVHLLISKTFYCSAGAEMVLNLNKMVEGFFQELKTYFLALLIKEKPGVLGFSVLESTLPASLFAAKLAKARYPEMKIVMGGGIFSEQLALHSPNWESFLEKVPYVDAFMVGEGELMFLKYLKGELPVNKRVFSPVDIGNVTMSLATAPLPDFSDFETDNYPFLAAYASRSCPYQCTFCSETVYYGKYRKKEAIQIAAELMDLHKKYGKQLFLMCDSLLNPVVADLAEAIRQSGTIVYWDGYLRADKPVGDIENTMAWRRGGFYKAKLGIESGSPRILEAMDKKINVEQIKNAVSSLAYAGIKTSTCWVIGHPGETEEDFQQTLDLIEELKDDIYEVWCSPFYYYPSAQANMTQWEKNAYLLYPEHTKNMLLIQTWYPDCDPSKEETHKRMNRFMLHCEKLGIPNPHTLQALYQADERWKKLHENAVPSIVEFENDGSIIDDTKKVKKLVLAQSHNEDSGDFGF